MLKRIIDISEPAYLHLRNQQLVIEKKGEEAGSAPVEDLGVLILQDPAVVITQALIIACQRQGVVVIFCDQQHLPYSVILPISDGHTLHTKVLREQVAISAPARKRLWKLIVQEKIDQQCKTLEYFNRNSASLKRIISQVKTGDRENHEAQAAQKYWPLLMGNAFRRDRDANGINALLNYGYSIVRAMIARAIVGSGLHPALGLHHKNQYNGLCLADDLMEPFRPWVDRIVCHIVDQGDDLQVNQSNKSALLELLGSTVLYQDKKMPFMVSSHYLMADIKRMMAGESNVLCYPSLLKENE